MAQPSVAREPSMEEILASIRQIIESNEPGAGRTISASLPPVYGDDEEIDAPGRSAVDDGYSSAQFPEPAAHGDPRFVAANSSGSSPELEMPARAMSLADVAARVRAASERNGTGPRDAAPAPQALDARATETRMSEPRLSEPRMSDLRMPELRTNEALFVENEPLRGSLDYAYPSEPLRAPEVARAPVVEPVPSYEEPVKVEPAATAPEQAPHGTPVSEPSRHMVSSQAFVAPLMQEANAALLSQDAGQQIARSFEQLAAAIDGAERRSLDEIAEDLLRPMLQEWLEDNLPLLVERLVREEIERVARGPRR